VEPLFCGTKNVELAYKKIFGTWGEMPFLWNRHKSGTLKKEVVYWVENKIFHGH